MIINDQNVIIRQKKLKYLVDVLVSSVYNYILICNLIKSGKSRKLHNNFFFTILMQYIVKYFKS